MWVPFMKTFAGLSALGAVAGSCAHGAATAAQAGQDATDSVGSAVDHVQDYANPRVCQATVDGTTATTVIGDMTFGVEPDAHGRNVITRELGKCNR